MSRQGFATLTQTQRRDLLLLLCRVARADGYIAEGERTKLRATRLRTAEGAVSLSELNAWLETMPPEPSALLPGSAKQLFRAPVCALVGD